MRVQLKELCSKKDTVFQATIERFSVISMKAKRKTILLSNITVEDGLIVTDHVWLNLTKTWNDYQIGDRVEFTATIQTYKKGYKGKIIFKQIRRPIESDFKLTNIKGVKLINRPIQKTIYYQQPSPESACTI